MPNATNTHTHPFIFHFPSPLPFFCCSHTPFSWLQAPIFYTQKQNMPYSQMDFLILSPRLALFFCLTFSPLSFSFKLTIISHTLCPLVNLKDGNFGAQNIFFARNSPNLCDCMRVCMFLSECIVVVFVKWPKFFFLLKYHIDFALYLHTQVRIYACV